MSLTKEQKAELRELSKEIYGTVGRAEKILKQGIPVYKTRTKIETITNEDGTTEQKETKEVIKSPNGQPLFEMSYPTAEELKVEMLAQKAQIEEFKKKIEAMQAEAKLKQEEVLKAQKAEAEQNEKINDITGSAV